MTLGVIVSLFGLGTALVLLFTLAIYAMPFFVGLTVGMWAFETGKNIAGLDRDAKEELTRLRVEVAQLRDEREKALSIANTADSLLKTERTAQEKLAQQLKLTEAENLALKNDLGFFERLLPSAGGESVLSIRGLQAEAVTPVRPARAVFNSLSFEIWPTPVPKVIC